jgi:S1-C subfamily serine protease
MLVDALIVIVGIGAIYRGRKIGFVRQVCSTAGFISGLLIGAWLEPHLINSVHSTESRAILTVVVILGSGLVMLTLGDYLGLHFKHFVRAKRLNSFDNSLGSVLSVVSLLLGVWLMASIANSSSIPSLQTAVRSSRIDAQLNRLLPPAPGVVAKLSHLIDPNGFPDVFIGNEPIPRTSVNLPDLGDLSAAVNADKNSVVRIEGQGCGGVVYGSGFVAGPGLVATNAHVVAGIRYTYAQDANGTHAASVVQFDPDLDFAVLRVDNLAGHSLKVSSSTAAEDTPAAVLGYPGGGDFSAKPALILDQIKASGRNIYGNGHTLRDVYELQADVVPGNSGGPVVGKDGKVIGVVFAESATYNHVGYALTSGQITGEIARASGSSQAVSTGRCAE